MAKLTFKPATKDRWPDLEALFGARGACGGCWCMYWRLPAKQYNGQKGAGNKRALKKLVNTGRAPGVLAYDGNTPIGWCAVAPRSEYVRLQTSRTLKPIDDEEVWSVSCLFIARTHRRQGVSRKLIEAAVEYAKQQGARIIEAYPIVANSGKMPDAFAWTGFPSAYMEAGFAEVARPSATRRIMRRTLGVYR